MKKTKTSYLLWALSFVGVAGIHRLYMGKVGTGILWLCTGGLFGFGTIYDAITMEEQVLQANLADHYQQVSYSTESYAYREQRPAPGRVLRPDLAALKLAKKQGGMLSPSQLALEAEIGADEAKATLEKFLAKGYAELQVRKSGVLVYVFPEFLTEEARADLEPLL